MPELPEVETVVRCLRPALARKRIVGVTVGAARIRRAWDSDWTGLGRRPNRIRDVRRRGKWIILELADGQSLLVHLGMTGRLHVVRAGEPVGDHTHFRFTLSPGKSELRFRDPRRFGSIGLKPTGALESFFADSGLGPEPFEMTAAVLFERLRESRRCLKAILLDQQVLAGVGNIYADESLFDARLHPETAGRDLDRARCGKLLRSIQKVLRRAIERKGSTIRDYFYAENGQGEFQNEFRVYQQTGEPCPRCGSKIDLMRLAGRATHYCPKCQR